jgi:hypothetical protein
MTQPPPDHFGRVLVLILVGFLLLGIEAQWAARLSLFTNAALLIVAFRTTSLRTTMPRLAAIAGIGIAAAVLGSITSAGDRLVALTAAGEFIVLSTLVLAILATVLRHEVVTSQTIIGVLSAYLLIGLAFSWLYLTVDIIDNDAFSLVETDVWSYSEFSFVVMTTLGFGNEIPTSPFAGRLVALEALTGQIFLVTLVARLVALYGERRPGPVA